MDLRAISSVRDYLRHGVTAAPPPDLELESLDVEIGMAFVLALPGSAVEVAIDGDGRREREDSESRRVLSVSAVTRNPVAYVLGITAISAAASLTGMPVDNGAGFLTDESIMQPDDLLAAFAPTEGATSLNAAARLALGRPS